MRHYVLVSLLALLCSATFADSDRFTATALNAHLTLLQGKGGNIVVSHGKDGLLMVDNDYADMTPALKEALKPLGGVERLKFIINTHWHGDHSGGNAALGADAIIVAHSNVRTRLSSRQEIKVFNMISEPQPEVALPKVTFDQEIALHFNGERIALKHYPHGHTDSDSVVWFESSKVLHMGDLFFHPMFPFVDVDNGGSPAQYARNIDALRSYADQATTLVPGHGPLATAADLADYLDMLNGTMETVSAMKQRGLSEAAAQAQGLGPQWDRYKNGFIKEPQWISVLYRSLEQ